jgi:hypothetical protein
MNLLNLIGSRQVAKKAVDKLRSINVMGVNDDVTKT